MAVVSVPSRVAGRLGFTTGDIARRRGCSQSQVVEVFKRGILPEPERVGPYRIISPEDEPKVVAALRQLGYIADEGEDEAFALAGK